MYGFCPDPEKVRAISEITYSFNCEGGKIISEDMQLLSSFHSPFLKIMAPIKLTKKGQKFCWLMTCQSAFECHKEHLAKLPLLSPPDLQKPLTLYIDISNVVVGACLVQTFSTLDGLSLWKSHCTSLCKSRLEHKISSPVLRERLLCSPLHHAKVEAFSSELTFCSQDGS